MWDCGSKHDFSLPLGEELRSDDSDEYQTPSERVAKQNLPQNIDFIQFSKSFSTFKNLKNANITLLNEIRKRPSLSAETNLFLQSKSGVFKRSSLINNKEPDCSQGMAYADFDLDGDLDVAINHLNKPASILENKSNQQAIR